MAKEGTFYFSHDYNAMADEKIKNLICEHGIAGYGAFWAIVEMLYNNANALRTHYKSISFDLHTDESFIKSVINDFGLFVVDGDYFGSNSVEQRLNERNAKSKKASESASYRWSKQSNDANALNLDANALRTECDSNAIKESKVKESKGKEIKDEYAAFLTWQKKDCQIVSNLKTQMTLENYMALRSTYTKAQVIGIIQGIENYKKTPTAYASVYLTALKWLKKEYPKLGEQEKIQEGSKKAYFQKIYPSDDITPTAETILTKKYNDFELAYGESLENYITDMQIILDFEAKNIKMAIDSGTIKKRI